MKKLILTISTIILVASIALCQDNQGIGDAYIDQMNSFSLFGSQKVFLENDLTLIQTGANNQAQITQSQDQAGAHSATVFQYGIREEVILSQLGANNQASFLQIGGKNKINIAQRGNFISSNVIQLGFENSVLQELEGNNKNYTIIQHGNNWGVIELGFSPDNPGYKIEQTGQVGVTMTIEHH